MRPRPPICSSVTATAPSGWDEVEHALRRLARDQVEIRPPEAAAKRRLEVRGFERSQTPLQPDGGDLVLGRPDQRVADVVREPVHLRFREVERHPDEARDRRGRRTALGPGGRRGATRAAPTRRRRRRAPTRPRRAISKNGSTCLSLMPLLAHGHRPPSCSGTAFCPVDKRRKDTRNPAPRSAAGTRRDGTSPAADGREGAPRVGTAFPDGRASGHGHCIPCLLDAGRSGSRTSSARGRRARSRPTRRPDTPASRSRARAPARSRSRDRRARCPGSGTACAHAVDPPLGVRERAVLLGEARGREDDVRVLASTSRSGRDPGRRRTRAARAPPRRGAAFGSVWAGFSPIEVERLDPPVVEAGHHLVEPVAGASRAARRPRPPANFSRTSGSSPGLVAGEVVRVRARVVQALDVVLAAERVQAGRLVAEVAGHQDEVRERPDVVDAAGVLGDPERVEDRRVPLGRVLAGRGADRLGRRRR